MSRQLSDIIHNLRSKQLSTVLGTVMLIIFLPIIVLTVAIMWTVVILVMFVVGLACAILLYIVYVVISAYDYVVRMSK